VDDPDDTQVLAPGRWSMWAIHDREGFFDEPGHRRYTLAHATQGQAAHRVIVTENPDGMYTGWMANGADTPTIIHRHPSAFSMCFPYGPAAEVKAGRGRIVKLDIAAA
jgi:ferredoxin-NADP reductase